MHQFWLTGQLGIQFLTGFSFLNNTGQFQAKRQLRSPTSGQFLSNSRVGHGVLDKFKLYIKYRPFQAKRKLRRVFWRKFWATGHFRTMFLKSLSFLTKDANSKQNDTCAECFDANFEPKESCARSFSQALASWQYGPIWSKTTVPQCDLGPISSNRKVVHGVFHRLWLPNNTG